MNTAIEKYGAKAIILAGVVGGVVSALHPVLNAQELHYIAIGVANVGAVLEVANKVYAAFNKANDANGDSMGTEGYTQMG